MNRKILIGCVE